MKEKEITSTNYTLSNHYYSNRKQLVFFSAILFFWEYLDLKISGTPFPNIELKIGHPDILPWILVVLVLYFFYRTILGWLISSLEVRNYKISKVDFITTLFIPFISILVFILQKGFKLNIGSFLSTDSFDQIIQFAFFMLGLPFFYFQKLNFKNRQELRYKVVLIGTSLAYLFFVLLLFFPTEYGKRIMSISIVTGSFLGLCYMTIFDLIKKFFKENLDPSEKLIIK